MTSKIKNITKDTAGSYGNNPKTRFLRDASISKIAQNGEEVKTSRETDAAYLAAVKAGDMETAQRMVDEAAPTTF